MEPNKMYNVILNDDGSILLKPRQTRAPRLKYGDVIDQVIDNFVGQPIETSAVVRSHTTGAIRNAFKKFNMRCKIRKMAKQYRYKVTLIP